MMRKAAFCATTGSRAGVELSGAGASSSDVGNLSSWGSPSSQLRVAHLIRRPRARLYKTRPYDAHQSKTKNPPR